MGEHVLPIFYIKDVNFLEKNTNKSFYESNLFDNPADF